MHSTHRAGRGVGEPPELSWLDCPQGRHGRGPGLEEQGEFATALLQDSHDELMARVNKTHVVEDFSDDKLNDGEDRTLRARERGGGGSVPPPSYANFRLPLALWSISPNHLARTKQETFCVRRGCRSSETRLCLETCAAGRHEGIGVGPVRTQHSTASVGQYYNNRTV